jgi:agmatine deiminase
MAWPCRLAAWGGGEAMARAKRAYAEIARAISTFEPVTMVVRPEDAKEAAARLGAAADIFSVPIDDSWTRDTGPTFLRGETGLAAIQWRFNAWGEKYAPFAADAGLAARIAGRCGVNVVTVPLTCEGGAIHSDGEGTIITTEQTLCNPNRNPDLPREVIETRLLGALGAKTLIWLGDGFSDAETDGHVDNIACFVAPGRVLVGRPASASHPDWEPVEEAIRRLRAARDAMGRALEIIEVEQPQRMRRDGRGRPLAASYVNFYLPNGAVLMPGFDDPSDDAAYRTIRDCFPARKIVQTDARAVVEGGGGIHCITCQEPVP